MVCWMVCWLILWEPPIGPPMRRDICPWRYVCEWAREPGVDEASPLFTKN